MKTIAIIGGGFSGTLTAIELLKKSKQVAVKLINCDQPLTKGVAFSTTDTEHLLNVPAGRMSAFEDEPDHFINWIKDQKEFVAYVKKSMQGEFLPRFIYGQYLTALFQPYLSNDQLEIIKLKATGIKKNKDNFTLTFNDNSSLDADSIVLAMGNFAPAPPKINNPTFYSSSSYYNNPWNQSYLENCNLSKNILLIGTGLTMVDCILSLKRIGFAGHIYITSPRGYTPVSHAKTVPYPDYYQELENTSLADIFKTVRKHIKIAETKDISWHSVTDALRPHVQKLWIGFSQKEKQQFISHIRHIWGVARHRLPQYTFKELQKLKEKGQLEIIGGRIKTIDEKDDDITVTIQLRKNKSTKELHVSRTVNCTGPQINYPELNDELVRSLLSSGLIAPSPLKMGIRALSNGSVLKNEEEISANMYAIGSLLRGVLWETTAVPELREQAENIAKQIIASIQ